jgi:hypothetical protein
MSGPDALETTEAVRHYVAKIEAHLARLAAGHDPMGHLFGIERLARGARAELWWTRREHEQARRSR